MAAITDFIWTTTRSPDEVKEWVQRTFVPVMRDWGFKAEQLSADNLVLVRKRSFWPLAFVNVLAFWLSPSQKEQVVVTVASAGTGLTRMTVIGEVPRKIAAVLQDLPQAGG